MQRFLASVKLKKFDLILIKFGCDYGTLMFSIWTWIKILLIVVLLGEQIPTGCRFLSFKVGFY